MATYESRDVTPMFWPNRLERKRTKENTVPVSFYVKDGIEVQLGDKVEQSAANGIDVFVVEEIKERRAKVIKNYNFIKALCSIQILTTK